MPTHFLRNENVAFMHKYSCYPEEQGVTSFNAKKFKFSSYIAPKLLSCHRNRINSSKHLEKVFC